jgi:hypothetical protein
VCVCTALGNPSADCVETRDWRETGWMEMDRAEPITIIIKTDNRNLTNIFPDRSSSGLDVVRTYTGKTKFMYFTEKFPPSFCLPFSPDLMLETFQSLDTNIGDLFKNLRKMKIKNTGRGGKTAINCRLTRWALLFGRFFFFTLLLIIF